MKYRVTFRFICVVALALLVVLKGSTLLEKYRSGNLVDLWSAAPLIAVLVFFILDFVIDIFLQRQEYRYTVNVSATEVSCVRSDGERESVLWDELQSVSADGAYMEGYTLLLNGVSSGCAVPDGAKGIEMLLMRLKELPGFNWEGIRSAAMAEEGGSYTCWVRGGAS